MKLKTDLTVSYQPHPLTSGRSGEVVGETVVPMDDRYTFVFGGLINGEYLNSLYLFDAGATELWCERSFSLSFESREHGVDTCRGQQRI